MAQEKQTPEEREAELARREAALAAREAQLAQEQAELAGRKADFEEGKKSLLNNGDKNFVNAKEKMYDHFPLTVHQMDIIIGVLFALIALFLALGRAQNAAGASHPFHPACGRHIEIEAGSPGRKISTHV